MKNFSYILSPNTRKEIENIEKARIKILLELIPPKAETQIRFDGLSKSISSSLFLSGKFVSTLEVKSYLLGKTKSAAADILALKKVRDYLKMNWLISYNAIEEENLLEILRIFDKNINISKSTASEILNFVNVNPEHPIIQQALSFILFYNALPKNKDSIKISINISKIFIYKHGFDFRELHNIEEYFSSDLINFNRLIEESLKTYQLSKFIEYFVQAFAIAAERAAATLKEEGKKLIPAASSLTERQEKILLLFDIPDAKITNRTVQKTFGISQITASRDLAKLATLGLIYQKGRGRSIYYTK